LIRTTEPLTKKLSFADLSFWRLMAFSGGVATNFLLRGDRSVGFFGRMGVASKSDASIHVPQNLEISALSDEFVRIGFQQLMSHLNTLIKIHNFVRSRRHSSRKFYPTIRRSRGWNLPAARARPTCFFEDFLSNSLS
jgi:hypothetical protein